MTVRTAPEESRSPALFAGVLAHTTRPGSHHRPEGIPPPRSQKWWSADELRQLGLEAPTASKPRAARTPKRLSLHDRRKPPVNRYNDRLNPTC